MRKLALLLLIWTILNIGPVLAGQSVITEATGQACMGDDRSRKATESQALAEAKRLAAEYAVSHVRSETSVKDAVVEKDLVQAYASARVRVLEELDRQWVKDANSGDCFRVRLRAEVQPDFAAIAAASKAALEESPAAPLAVKVWTDRQEYRQGEKVKVYLKGNKPFYVRLMYKDASGALYQLLPNPHRQNNRFEGGVTYDLPSGGDSFDIEVTPPFGSERLIVYASTAQLGEVETSVQGGVYGVKTKVNEVGMRTRGLKITPAASGSAQSAEFSESAVEILTAR